MNELKFSGSRWQIAYSASAVVVLVLLGAWVAGCFQLVAAVITRALGIGAMFLGGIGVVKMVRGVPLSFGPPGLVLLVTGVAMWVAWLVEAYPPVFIGPVMIGDTWIYMDE